MMQKNLKLILVLLLLFMNIMVAVGCDTTKVADEVAFMATVIDVDQKLLMVEPDEGSSELSSADKIVVYISDTVIFDAPGNEISYQEIEAGAKIRIFYDGLIAESYPAQIHNCHKIKLL